MLPKVTVSATDPSAVEGDPGDPGAFTVTRSGDMADDLVVELARAVTD